jgi:3-deoxy-manno-octulosonate cytidylyltransferase (CMP-KDO synthetase)
MKVIGLIPARMAASRFPGKPLAKIAGMTMLEHVYRRAELYEGWDRLAVATCDAEIRDFSEKMGFEVIDTGDHHVRALDRVAEAMDKLGEGLIEEDVVVCVQGDEPLLDPAMIQAVVDPIKNLPDVSATLLGVHVTEEDIWLNPDSVKLISNEVGEILYTSRAPIPYAKHGFSADLMARRIGGIFAFRPDALKAFTNHPETRLEILEACDSNRLLDMGYRQLLAPYPAVPMYSVDSPSDILLVEKALATDALFKKYGAVGS